VCVMTGRGGEGAKGVNIGLGICVCQHVREHVYIPCVCVLEPKKGREGSDGRTTSNTHTHIEERKENTLLHTNEKKEGKFSIKSTDRRIHPTTSLLVQNIHPKKTSDRDIRPIQHVFVVPKAAE